jgi:polysaccharide biosynthesis transport protein
MVQQVPSERPSTDRGEIDLAALLREVGRSKWLVLLATLGALALSTAAVSMLKPRYTAETRILVENRDTEYTRFGRESRGTDPLIDQEQVQSQVQLITSRDLARRMIERFDLGSLREFDPVIDGIGTPARIMVMLGLIDNPANVSPQERVLERYYDNLKAFALTRSRVLAVEFQSRDPELAAKLSNAIAEEYIQQLEQAKKGTAQNAGGWLARTIEPLRQRVAEAEAKVEAFRTQNGLFQSGENSTISVQQLSELNTQLATARAQQAELTAKARIIREAVRQGRIFEVSEVANNEVVRRLIERRAELKAQIAQEERTLLPQHPRIRELNAQLAGMEEQVRAAADRAARALENDARAAGARVAASQAELDQQKRQTGTSNEAEVQLKVLEREAKAEREQLETYLARYRDASVRNIENAVAADARIVSRATVPSAPTFPKRLPIIIIATLAAFTLSLFLVLTRALLSERIYVVRAAAQASAPAAVGQPVAALPTVSPELLQAFYAHQAAMMATVMTPSAVAPAAPVQTTASVVPSVPEPMAPVAVASVPTASVPTASVPQPSSRPAATAALAPAAAKTASVESMRESLERMRRSLREPAPVSPPRPVATPPAAATAALAVPAPHEDLAIIADAPSLAEMDEAGYDPLQEIADTAAAARLRGRPVAIMLLSVRDAAFADGTAAALTRRLLVKGTATRLTLDQTARTAERVAEVMSGMAPSHDFVVMNGGPADAAGPALSQAVAITVLVASEDLLDPSFDAASRNLEGCNYFIVGAAAPVSV